jgi:hypothetical protein
MTAPLFHLVAHKPRPASQNDQSLRDDPSRLRRPAECRSAALSQGLLRSRNLRIRMGFAALGRLVPGGVPLAMNAYGKPPQAHTVIGGGNLTLATITVVFVDPDHEEPGRLPGEREIDA